MSEAPFSQIVQDSAADGQARLVIFYSDTCAPCKILKPELRRWCQDWGLPLFEANVKEHMNEVRELGLRALPSVVLVHGSKVLIAFTGNIGRETALRCLQGHGLEIA